jgi:acyl-coenzyme A thioesterase PaaI-like protein
MLRRLDNDDWGYESNCYVCEQKNERGLQIPFFHDTDRQIVTAQFELSDTYSGAPTLVHGGVQLAVLDEAMAWATIAIAHQWALTAVSSAEFLALVMVGTTHRVEATIESTSGDVITTAGTIFAVDGSVCTTASARFTAIGEAIATRLVGEPLHDEHRDYLSGGGPDER